MRRTTYGEIAYRAIRVREGSMRPGGMLIHGFIPLASKEPEVRLIVYFSLRIFAAGVFLSESHQNGVTGTARTKKRREGVGLSQDRRSRQ